jgi:hypothetical protein
MTHEQILEQERELRRAEEFIHSGQWREGADAVKAVRKRLRQWSDATKKVDRAEARALMFRQGRMRL